METKNHWHLAKFICSERNFEKYQKEFLLGNIMPDINLFTYLQGHTYKDSIDMIYANTKSLIEKKIWNSISFYQLGIILHYVADYFTFPHNANFTGTLKEHCAYERKLRTHFCYFLKNKTQKYTKPFFHRNTKDTYAIQNLADISAVDSSSIPHQNFLFHIHSITDLFTLLEEKHHEYLSMMPSFQTDCQYIFSLTNIMSYFIPKLHKEYHCKNCNSSAHRLNYYGIGQL
ncbi:MAG: zinc dependent phospholipase C family protein [Lachnospiraceae bacterium]|nr:zinc dependent phospholipase C family protein [Lachnospiraceae bacterium]